MSLIDTVFDTRRIKNQKKRVKALRKIIKKIDFTQSNQFDSEQQARLLRHAEGYFDSWEILEQLVTLAVIGPSGSLSTIESPFHDYLPDDLRKTYFEGTLYELFMKNKVFQPDEVVSYTDYVDLYLGSSMAFRRGKLYITDRRLVVIGTYYPNDDETYRLYYPDAMKRPYHPSVDYIEYHRINSGKNVWGWGQKGIFLKYDTRYYRKKGFSIAVPYVLTFPKQEHENFGELAVTFKMTDLKYSGIPKDFKKKRQAELGKRINGARKSISQEPDPFVTKLSEMFSGLWDD